MTIKSRNRFNLIFICIAIVIAVLQSGLFIYQLITNNFTVPTVYNPNDSHNIVFKYNYICVLIGIFIMNIYVIVSSIVVLTFFEKTQSTQIVFYLIFLLACLCDTSRILLPLFHVSNTYSRLLMDVAYLPLFARLLAPLSLLGITVLSDEEARHNVNRNTVFIIIASLFFAKIIPFNTAVILPNFCVSYGYTNTIRFASFFICLAGISTLAISNYKNNSPQFTTIGYAVLAIGYSSLFYCYNIFHLVVGVIAISSGTALYLFYLHKQFLWSDESYNE